MARLHEPTPEEEAGWKEWVASLPEAVRRVAERFEPWSLYRMKETGHRVTLYSFGEGEDGNVTLTVNVLGDYNLVVFERRVFGVSPDDLEPCELPGEDEAVGAMLTDDEDIDAFIEKARPSVLAARSNQK